MRETHSVWNCMTFQEGCVDPATITLGKLFEDCATWHKIKEIPFTWNKITVPWNCVVTVLHEGRIRHFSPSAIFYLSACTIPPPPPTPELGESFSSPSAEKIIKAGILLVAEESSLQTTYRRERHEGSHASSPGHRKQWVFQRQQRRQQEGLVKAESLGGPWSI